MDTLRPTSLESTKKHTNMKSFTLAVFVIVALAAVQAGVISHGLIAAHGPAVVSAYSAPVFAHHGIYGHGPAVVDARGLISPYGYAGVGLYPEGSGIRGQYVHDYTETLYDDGSYKGEIYP